MAAGIRKDPYHAYNFLIEIDGITRAGFREASGLDSTQDPIEYREGNEKTLTVRKLPGLNTYGQITLQWGTSDDEELWQWRLAAMQGDVERRNVSIVILDEAARQEKVRYNLREAWPSKWTGPSLNATDSQVAIDSLEITHEGILKA